MIFNKIVFNARQTHVWLTWLTDLLFIVFISVVATFPLPLRRPTTNRNLRGAVSSGKLLRRLPCGASSGRVGVRPELNGGGVEADDGPAAVMDGQPSRLYRSSAVQYRWVDRPEKDLGLSYGEVSTWTLPWRFHWRDKFRPPFFYFTTPSINQL